MATESDQDHATKPLRRLTDLRALGAIRDNEQTRLMAMGVGVGLIGGVCAALFDRVMTGTGALLLGTAEPSVHSAPMLWLLIAPLLGAAVVGASVAWLTRDGRPRGIADVVESVRLHGGAMSARNGVASALAAAVSLGAGHSGGRESPIVHLSASLSAYACRMLGVPPARMRILVAAGAAAGIGASFNTPLGAAFFAMEILLGNFALEGFAPIVAATVSGTIVGQALMGDRLALHLPVFQLVSPLELLIYPVLGALCGVVAVAFKELMLWAGDQWERVPLPAAARPLLAGGGVGIVAAVGMPEVMGNGYAYVEQLIDGQGGPIWFLLVLGVAKLAVTALSVVSRNAVGLFAPALFIGAVTGSLFGTVVNDLWPGVCSPVGAYGMVGMGALVAALTQAPITMVLMLFEMTGNYEIILPVLLTLAVSGVVCRAVDKRSLFIHSLLRRGVSIDRGREELVMYELHVQDIMRSHFASLSVDAPFAQLAELFLHQRIYDVYVIDSTGAYHGFINIQDIKGLLGSPHQELSVLDVERRDLPTVSPEQPLTDVLSLFFRYEVEELPVVDGSGRLIGVLSERDVVGAYNREVLRKETLLTRVESGSMTHRQVDFLELAPGQRMDVADVDEAFCNRTLRELVLPARYGVTVVAVDVWDAEAGRHTRIAAEAGVRLQSGDRIVVLGPEEQVAALCGSRGGRSET